MGCLDFNPTFEMGSSQGGLNHLPDWPPERPRATVPTAPLQVWESAEAYMVYLLIPGADRESLDIEATPHQLSISGKIKLSGPCGAELRYLEMEAMSFQRSLKLDQCIQLERVVATYTDGILSLTLPKAEAARGVKVQLSTPRGVPELETVSVEGHPV